jgi:hypothetical protein
MAEALDTRLKLLEREKAIKEEIKKIEEDSTKTEEEKLALIEKQKKAQLAIGKQLKEINKTRNAGLMAEEQANSNLGDLYSRIAEKEQHRLAATLKSKSLSDRQTTDMGRMAEISREMAQLSITDVVQRAALNDEFKLLKGTMGDLNDEDSKILDNLESQFEIAKRFSTLNKEQKAQLEAQLGVYKGIKQAINGVLDTLGILTSGFKGFVATGLFAAGAFATQWGKVRGELGGISEIGTTALSFIDDNAVANAKELASNFGGINNVSGELQAATSLISTNMGISGVEGAKLLGTFARLNGNSASTALDLAKSTQEFAKQNGIIPADLMSDVAGSAEEFALFGKDGGKNLITAAAAAAKMGVSLKTMTGIADNLLDFETSIGKELELGAMLGRNINLDKARQLAYQGDIEGSTKETLRALGGVDAFNKMDYFQKKAAAELMGVTVEEMQKMVTQQENANTMGGMMNEKFSMMNESIDAGLNKYLGTSLQGLSGMVIAAGQIGTGFKAMDGFMGGILSGTLKTLKGLLMWPINQIQQLFTATPSIAEEASDTIQDKASDKLSEMAESKVDDLTSPESIEEAADATNKDKSMGDKLKDLAKGLKAMGNAQVLFGALNLIPTALGFVAILPGLPGMFAISAIGVPAGVGLRALASGLKAFGKAAPEALIGIGLLALFGIALIPFTYALSLLAPLVVSIGTAIGTVIESIGRGIASIVASIGDLLVKVLPLLNLEAAAGILAMAAAFAILAGSLAMLSTIGLAALPVLLAVGAVGALGVGLGVGGGGGEDSKMDELIAEIKGLREDMATGKIGVNMDGKKVTAGVSRVVATSSTNSYHKK